MIKLPKEIRIKVPTSDEVVDAIKKAIGQLEGLAKIEIVEEKPPEGKPPEEKKPE